VTTSVSFGAHQLAPAIADYLVAYPDVAIDLSLHDNYVDLLEERIDLAIRLGQLSDSSLIAKKLYAVEMILCASPTYLAAHGTPQKPRDLVEHSCLIYTYAAPRAWTFTDQKNGEEEVVRISGRLMANSGDALLAFALKDTGVVLGPDYLVADELRAGRLIRLLPIQDAGNASLCRLSAQPLSVGENQDIHRLPRGAFRTLARDQTKRPRRRQVYTHAARSAHGD
jgi:DNA-binding transcriptional LysR family regulator